MGYALTQLYVPLLLGLLPLLLAIVALSENESCRWVTGATYSATRRMAERLLAVRQLDAGEARLASWLASSERRLVRLFTVGEQKRNVDETR